MLLLKATRLSHSSLRHLLNGDFAGVAVRIFFTGQSMVLNLQFRLVYSIISANLLTARFLSIVSHHITDLKIEETEEPHFQWRLNGFPN